MLQCEQCDQRPAVVEFIQVIGNVRKHTHLCRECAVEHSLEGSIGALRAFAQQIFGELFTQAEKRDENFTIPEKPCSSCGITFQQFLETSLLGCPACYQEFHVALKPILRRIHGGSRIRTSDKEFSVFPPPDSDLLKLQREKLKQELQKALVEENYELAAQIRDKLKQVD
jgi:protein arginine kinase activator